MRNIIIFLLLALVVYIVETHSAPEPCSTDTECMAQCPVDDTTCDGGPQS